MADKFFITTPIYYVNDEPHIGHAYTSIIADVLSRYHRLFGDRVFFLTGTDEHGQKVAEAAAKAGRTPQEHCDLMVQRFQAAWDKLEISHDDFIRTTEPRHTTRVQEILQKLWDAGEIYESTYEGWYCVPDERFWTEKDLVDGNCPLCGREVRRLAEKNYFFRMGRYQEWLLDHIQSHPRFILPESRRNEILGFLAKPLGDLCISRPKERLSWGVPLPFAPDFVTYVWFDALLNYVTAPESRGGGWWPASLHLIGKDILTTHSVYWPTMLKAAGLELPETILGHGWWLYDDMKMSKSLGNVVKPLDLADKYGVDAFRFFVAREMSLGLDASFSEAALVNRYNSELANDLGNLYSRILKLLHTYNEGKIPQAGDNPNAIPNDVFEGKEPDYYGNLWEGIKRDIRQFELNTVLNKIMQFVRLINRHMEQAAPWKSGKTDPEGAVRFLRSSLEELAAAAWMLWPVMPGKMGELLGALGLKAQDYHSPAEVLKALPEGHLLPEKAALFPRVKLEAPAPAEPPPPPPPETPVIAYEDFQKVQLRVARILTAEPVQGADKLLRLEVDLGSERRQIVAGIAQHYRPEELPGRSIIVVANLQPAKIRGVESRGMLLAAQGEGGKLVLLTPDGEAPPGAKIS
ncbi:MAG: methionine--tRNA ligase [Candidatus Zixiibacteriota bacterium]|nr:MAG: methionine--tRNA ligase [candidate division Zixibacteria bacterium]